MQLNSKTTNNLIKKWAEELNIFLKKTQTASSHEKLLSITNHQGNAN